jgi:uncharacterized protein Yka (UPF0111/DUF47 family)
MFNLMPRDEKFYDQLEQLGELVAGASRKLVEMVKSFPNTADQASSIAEDDRKADELAQATLQRLDHAFITPLDREDIMHLVNDLYEVVETIRSFARRTTLYRLNQMDRDLAEQVGILAKVAECVRELMSRLRKDHRLNTLNGELKELHDLERMADDRRGDFLAHLFEGKPDPLDVMKKKELHDLMETAIANCQNVSRTLQRVVLKNS